MKKFVIIIAFCGFTLSMISSADAARRAKGPIIIVTEVKDIISHN
jgi:DNA-binding MurR/RpiR family transcriptional regulator